jgi:hypothetical protein
MLGRETYKAGTWAGVAGLLGGAATLYDRQTLTQKIDESDGLSGLIQVGWGLNLALAASISLLVAGVMWFKEGRAAVASLVAPPTDVHA